MWNDIRMRIQCAIPFGWGGGSTELLLLLILVILLVMLIAKVDETIVPIIEAEMATTTRITRYRQMDYQDNVRLPLITQIRI